MCVMQYFVAVLSICIGSCVKQWLEYLRTCVGYLVVLQKKASSDGFGVTRSRTVSLTPSRAAIGVATVLRRGG